MAKWIDKRFRLRTRRLSMPGLRLLRPAPLRRRSWLTSGPQFLEFHVASTITFWIWVETRSQLCRFWLVYAKRLVLIYKFALYSKRPLWQNWHARLQKRSPPLQFHSQGRRPVRRNSLPFLLHS